MGTVRIIVLVVAAVAAIGLALVVRNMAARRAAPAPVAVAGPSRPSVQVLVARRDLTVGERIAAGDVGWQAWPADALNPAFITDGALPASAPPTVGGRIAAAASETAAAIIGGPNAIQSAMGDVVREPILSGEPLTAGKLIRGGAGGFMSVVLQPGMRAVSMPVTVETAAGGFVLPGDRVDVVMSRKSDQPGISGSAPATASTILRNLKVLAIDQQVSPAKNARTIIGAVATLEVPASDVELMLKSKAQGQLSLILRSYADMGGPSGSLQAGLGDGASVRVIRGGRVSEVMTR